MPRDAPEIRVQLLFWEGCPSHPAALEDLESQMASLGLDPASVELREIGTEEQAAAERFPGSPTIRIDGVDVVDPGGQPSALTCRVYRRRDGRISPTPDPADVRESLVRAIGRGGAQPRKTAEERSSR
jgi:hypothetical protein